MISRRRFLEVSSATAGLAVASGSLVNAAAAEDTDHASLPPSLAKLKSRKSESTPISRDERRVVGVAVVLVEVGGAAERGFGAAGHVGSGEVEVVHEAQDRPPVG